MRLLNTSTGLPEEFIGTNIPPYAILSHTWGQEEVSHKDMTTDPSYRSMKGYEKILMTCQLAKADELQYAWIDTCCIDKTSSAELAEAINSMFQWYKKAEKCYAYLVDVKSNASWPENLAHCRWFTRGWTLQELIAPAEICFFDQHWNMIFRKSDRIQLLSNITGIDRGVLEFSRSLLSISVAQRMSWATRRVTTRVEDEAYCLLGICLSTCSSPNLSESSAGIFDVHMPMLYGEGRRAFLRLQEEIVRICPDLSIFAWKSSVPQVTVQEGPTASSIFASSAADFAESSCFAAVNAHSTNDFFLSNQGIKLHTRLGLQHISGQQGYRYVFPVCKKADGTILGIRLRKCGASQLVREDPSSLVRHDSMFPSMQSRTLYLLSRLPSALHPHYLLRDIVLHTRFRILEIVLPRGMAVTNVSPWSRWDVTDQVFFVSDDLGLDYGAAKLSGVLDVGSHDRVVNAHFDFMLYSLHWANIDFNGPMVYTIVPWKPSDGTLKDLNDKLDQYDYVTGMVEDDLSAYKIRMSPSAEYQVDDARYMVTVNCSSHLVNDQTKCLFPFWRLKVSWNVHKNPN